MIKSLLKWNKLALKINQRRILLNYRFLIKHLVYLNFKKLRFL